MRMMDAREGTSRSMTGVVAGLGYKLSRGIVTFAQSSTRLRPSRAILEALKFK